MRQCFALIALLLTLSPTAASADIGDNAVGMNVHDGRATFIDACADLGVQWVRVDAVWFLLEPSDDAYNWGYVDDAVTAAAASGLNVFLTLGYTPTWVPVQGDADGMNNNNVPQTSAEWVDFVTDAVNHFRPMGVTHFGLWNEANLSGFWEGSLDQYVDLIVVPGAAAVRAACNDCLVLGPELAHVGAADDALESVMSRAPIDTFDIVTHHSYNGFAELGTTAFDGDRFPEVLDMQRLPGITRRSLRQVLDGVGWDGEVWISETGFRVENNPENNPADEAKQARYYELVLEEQLKRAWYTNTFFYEIHDCGPDQPACDIDGFGIMRATSPMPRTFPASFRTKPAFDALKSFIASHDEFRGAAPVACADGVDNDGDGFTDADDLGCADGTDDDEADDPPPPALQVVYDASITLDGDLREFDAGPWVTLHPSNDWRGNEVNAAADLSVRAAARWSRAGLFLAVEVTDDVQQNDNVEQDLWLGDSLQLAFDIGQSGGRGYDNLDDHEINFALTNEGVKAYRFHGPANAMSEWSLMVARDATTTSYEIHINPTSLPSALFEGGRSLGFSFVVNDDDGAGRRGWMQWTDGIGSEKAPYYFGELALLAEGEQPTDMGGGNPDVSNAPADMDLPDATGGSDMGTTPPDGEPTPTTTTGDSGCSCRTAHGFPSAWALLLLTLFSIRRTNPRSARDSMRP